MAEGTTVGDFLTWEEPAQDSFIQTSIMMLVTVAAQISPDTASCLGDWYFLEEDRDPEVLAAMKDYTEFGPSAFIYGYATSLCGEILR